MVNGKLLGLRVARRWAGSAEGLYAGYVPVLGILDMLPGIGQYLRVKALYGEHERLDGSLEEEAEQAIFIIHEALKPCLVIHPVRSYLASAQESPYLGNALLIQLLLDVIPMVSYDPAKGIDLDVLNPLIVYATEHPQPVDAYAQAHAGYAADPHDSHLRHTVLKIGIGALHPLDLIDGVLDAVKLIPGDKLLALHPLRAARNGVFLKERCRVHQQLMAACAEHHGIGGLLL